MTQATEGHIGYLAEVRVLDTASPHAAALIAEVVSFSGLGEDNALVEMTHLQSPNGALEYISGMADGKEVTLVCNLRLDSATQGASAGGLIYLQKAKAKPDFEFWHPEWGVTVSLTALVKGYEFGEVSANTGQKITFTLKISGGITYTED